MTEERGQFPLDALPPAIAEQVNRIAKYQNVDPVLPAMGFLGGASFAIGRGFDYALNATTKTITPSNLWITAIAKSGIGKSSLMFPLRIIEQIYVEQDNLWKEETKPQLVAELRKLEALLEEYKKKKLWEQVADTNRDIYDKQAEINAGRPTWLHENFTTETLSTAFSCRGRVPYACIMSPEGRGIAQNLVSNYADKSTEGFWLAGWSRVDTNIRTRMNYHLTDTDGVIDGLQITACFGLQLDKHQELMKPPFSVSGWSQRRLFCIAQPSGVYMSEAQAEAQAKALGLTPPDMTAWETWVRKMIKTALSPAGKRCMPTAEAVKVLDDWYTLLNSRIQEGIFGELESHARRWGEMAIRIALCLHCMQHAEASASVKISAETMSNAVRIMRWFALEMRHSYWDVEVEGKNKKRESIEKYALNRGVNGFAMRDLAHAGIGTKNELLPIIEKMITDRKLMQLPLPVVPNKKGPRPVRWIHTRVAKQVEEREKISA